MACIGRVSPIRTTTLASMSWHSSTRRLTTLTTTINNKHHHHKALSLGNTMKMLQSSVGWRHSSTTRFPMITTTTTTTTTKSHHHRHDPKAPSLGRKMKMLQRSTAEVTGLTYSKEQLTFASAFFEKESQFITFKSATNVESIPPPADATYEIAFAGKSNVGKSSLINSVLASRQAKISKTPGKTQSLNFYSLDRVKLRLVDLPGYGYAVAPLQLVKAWNQLASSYLLQRSQIRRVFLLIDSRHGVKPMDFHAMDLFDHYSVSYQVVLTKSDKIKPTELQEMVAKTRKEVCDRSCAFPEISFCSSKYNIAVNIIQASIIDSTNLWEEPRKKRNNQ